MIKIIKRNLGFQTIHHRQGMEVYTTTQWDGEKELKHLMFPIIKYFKFKAPGTAKVTYCLHFNRKKLILFSRFKSHSYPFSRNTVSLRSALIFLLKTFKISCLNTLHTKDAIACYLLKPIGLFVKGTIFLEQLG